MPNPPADHGQPGPGQPMPSDGMGPTPSGPSFAPGGRPPLTGRPVGPAPSARPDPASYRPPRSQLPAILTAAVVGVVALVVVVASAIAYRADRHVAAAPPPIRPTGSPYLTATKDSIEFTTRTGAGRLTILDHSWQPARTISSGSALQVGVRISCTDGVVDYDPFNFQVFDAAGNLFDLATEEVQGPLLGVGRLQPGGQTEGSLAFVIPRGEVTLLMSDDASSVTALKVPD